VPAATVVRVEETKDFALEKETCALQIVLVNCLGENNCFCPLKLYSQNPGKFLLLAWFVLVKAKKSYALLIELCSYIPGVLVKPSKIRFGDRDLRAEGHDPWSDRRFVCVTTCQAYEQVQWWLLVGALWPRFTRRIYNRWMSATLRFVWDSIWFVRSFLSRSVGSMQRCRL
jgi:hypothetical protein